MGKVLVVDDDANITLLLQRIISKKGHQIITARNGWEGLNRAQAELPDLIFTDVRMPDLSGLELTTFLRADPALEHIPIVILSGTAYLVDLNDTQADAILTKPFDLKTVYSLLDQFLDPVSADEIVPPAKSDGHDRKDGSVGQDSSPSGLGTVNLSDTRKIAPN